MLTDYGGWPVSSSTYYPFGPEPTQSSDNNHYKFTGQERDTESGLDFFNARHYSITTGRFMSPDPYNGSFDLANPQSFNRYAYVGNNPLSFTDPSGLLTCGNCTGGGGDGGILAAIFTVGVTALVGEHKSLFYHPKFHGSKLPRPSWDPHNAHLGLPNIGAILDLPDTSCEFGAFGGGLGFTEPGQANQNQNGPQYPYSPPWLPGNRNRQGRPPGRPPEGPMPRPVGEPAPSYPPANEPGPVSCGNTFFYRQ